MTHKLMAHGTTKRIILFHVFCDRALNNFSDCGAVPLFEIVVVKDIPEVVQNGCEPIVGTCEPIDRPYIGASRNFSPRLVMS